MNDEIARGFVYTRDPVTDSRGECENESGKLSTVRGKLRLLGAGYLPYDDDKG